MPKLTRPLSPRLDADLLGPARQLADRFDQSASALPHLLLAELNRAGSKLAAAVGGERLDSFRAGLEPHTARGPRRAAGRPVVNGDEVEAIVSALRAGEGPDCLANVLRRASGGPVGCDEVAAAALDYRPHPAAPLLARLGLTSAALPDFAAAAEKVAAGDAPPSRPADVLIDLTALAEQNRLGEVIGRERELEAVVRVLLRRHCNNPILLGFPNVGKTAIAEALARRLAAGAVPPGLHGRRLMQLHLTRLVAGTKYRGEFEARIEEALAQLKTISAILFIDEIHLLCGLGRADGAMDAANILKPALARGELRCVGATTLDEYRLIEEDSALARRFSPVPVADMTRAETRRLLEQVAPAYAKHHAVAYDEAALSAIVRLAAQARPDGHSPGREIDLLDEAGAQAAAADGAARTVSAGDVARLVARHAGLPAERVDETAARRHERVMADLDGAVAGQPDALREIERRLRGQALGAEPAAAGPRACLLFRGPEGVGKRLAARTLAAALLGPGALVRTDLAACRDDTCSATLLGAARGHVGYELGGELTEPVRRRPNSLVLIEHVDRAHPAARRIVRDLLQRGALTDNHGREVSFRSAVVVLTSDEYPPERNGHATAPRPDGAWAALTGPAIDFRPLTRQDLEIILDRALARCYESAARAAGFAVSGAAAVERGDAGRALRLTADDGTRLLLDIAAPAAAELMGLAHGDAASVAPVVDVELSAALGGIVLKTGAFPTDARIEMFREP